MPLYRVLVAQSNSKDWNYDKSGLLKEVFKNYMSLYKLNHINYIDRFIAEIIFLEDNLWRIRVDEIPKYIEALKDQMLSSEATLLLKIYLPNINLKHYMRKNIKQVYLRSLNLKNHNK